MCRLLPAVTVMVRPIKQTRLAFTLFAGLASFGVFACEPVAERAELRNGVYCLDADVGLDSLPFYIYDNTTLDCRGHRIKDIPAAVTSAVVAWGDNIVVKNCVFDGFHSQLDFRDTTNYRIQDNLLINARSRSIVATGNHGLIARNVIRNPPSMGILVSSLTSTLGTLVATAVVNNTVILGGASAPVTGILTYSRGLVANNVVVLHPTPGQGGQAIASSLAVTYRNLMVAAPGSHAAGLV